MRPFDTSQAAHSRQIEIYRAMSCEERSSLALRMSEDIREVTLAGIRQRHPDYSETAVHRAFVALLHGRTVAARLWPGEPIPEP